MEAQLYNAFDPALRRAGGKSELPAGSAIAADLYYKDWLDAHPAYTWMDLSGEPTLPPWRLRQWAWYDRLRAEAAANAVPEDRA